MAYPVCITVPENAAPPTDCEADYIKHVDYLGENDNDYRFEYRKLERSLLFEYLRRTNGNGSFPGNLMSVSFSEPIVQNGSNNFCVGILKRNIFCEGRHYRYLGHSDSQFREKKCYLMNASEDEIHDLLARFDNFVKITDVRKRAKRISLLFVGFDHMLKLAREDYKVEPDVKSGLFGTKPHAFTNSCGFMSNGFTTEVRRQLGLSYPEPSAVQVNYQGFQGTLVLKDDPTNAPQVQLRQSMQKFNIPNNEVRQHIPFIGILDYSKPHINGYLDTRLIILLQSRGVPISYLQALHEGYLDLLRKIPDDSASAQYFLRLTGRDAGNIRSGIDRPTREVLTTIKRNEIKEMIDRSYVLPAEDDEPPRSPVVRVRILVPKARVVFGVCDPHDRLQKGQCYFKPTLLDDEAGEFSSEEQIVVARYPCYHPGDIQVLNLTHGKLGYENLKDCLVLPGKDHAFESCGGDLGGSKFFVSWDQQLVPKKAINPCSYSPTIKEYTSEAWAKLRTNVKWLFKRNRERKKRCREELIEYFANFTDDLPQRIEKTYMKLAATHGPSSKQCKQLSKMSYQAANQTVDRDVLSQKLAMFEKNETTRTTSSAEASSSEGSPLLRTEEDGEEEPGDRNEDEDETSVEMTNYDGTRAVRFFCGARRKTPLMRHEVRKLEERAKKFVEEALQE